ncbi:MAG: UbiA family prenyltransferase [Myxococcales bacterium]|nr:UbiA family prenyltransferase [Myxococcales bacterium]
MNALQTFASISRFHIVAIATVACLTFGWLFTGQYLWVLSLVCGADWFIVNLLNRVVDLPEDRANQIAGTGFVERHRRALLLVGFGTLIGSIALVHLRYPEVLPLRLGYHALGLSYNWPLLPGGKRIKQLYFWKNTASATGFLLTVFGYPLVVSLCGSSDLPFPPGINLTTIALTAVFFMLFELSYEVIYDLRDAPGDAREGVKTYPVVHGQRGAVRIIDGLVTASVITIVAGYFAGPIPWRILVMVLAPILQLVLYKRALARGITSRDCVQLTWLGAALLAAYNGWVFAGLPGVGV